MNVVGAVGSLPTCKLRGAVVLINNDKCGKFNLQVEKLKVQLGNWHRHCFSWEIGSSVDCFSWEIGTGIASVDYLRVWSMTTTIAKWQFVG